MGDRPFLALTVVAEKNAGGHRPQAIARCMHRERARRGDTPPAIAKPERLPFRLLRHKAGGQTATQRRWQQAPRR